MKGALIILVVTIIAGIILYLLDLRQKGKEDHSDQPVGDPTDDASEGSLPADVADGEAGECCGLHLVCEKELKAIAEDRALYYDDEELDRFAGRTPEEYDAEETEEFRDIMLTLLPRDVPGWARSLDRRGIRPPREIRDELMILLSEVGGT